jgi:hypothetical protein
MSLPIHQGKPLPNNFTIFLVKGGAGAMKQKDKKKKTKRELWKEMLKKNLKNLKPSIPRKGPASQVNKTIA